MSNYWRETVRNGLEEVGIAATDEQVERLAEGFAISAENANMGAPDMGVGHANEIEALKREHRKVVDGWEHAFHTFGTVMLPLAGYKDHTVRFTGRSFEVVPRFR